MCAMRVVSRLDPMTIDSRITAPTRRRFPGSVSPSAIADRTIEGPRLSAMSDSETAIMTSATLVRPRSSHELRVLPRMANALGFKSSASTSVLVPPPLALKQAAYTSSRWTSAKDDQNRSSPRRRRVVALTGIHDGDAASPTIVVPMSGNKMGEPQSSKRTGAVEAECRPTTASTVASTCSTRPTTASSDLRAWDDEISEDDPQVPGKHKHEVNAQQASKNGSSPAKLRGLVKREARTVQAKKVGGNQTVHEAVQEALEKAAKEASAAQKSAVLKASNEAAAARLALEKRVQYAEQAAQEAAVEINRLRAQAEVVRAQHDEELRAARQEVAKEKAEAERARKDAMKISKEAEQSLEMAWEEMMKARSDAVAALEEAARARRAANRRLGQAKEHKDL